jgi:hypothetical protein
LYKKPKSIGKVVFEDLKIAHPTIEEDTESIELPLGHGMVSPVPDFIYIKPKKMRLNLSIIRSILPIPT